nr:MAG TPA: hypothetical protein [Caudoviricetes sp.]DAK84619.1 MAG TPA: hypothetical protein [Caudoviricetes sp.]
MLLCAIIYMALRLIFILMLIYGSSVYTGLFLFS